MSSATKPPGSPGRGLENVQPPKNPAGPGNTRSVTHGAHSELLIAPRAAEIRNRLRELVPAYTPSDDPAVTLLALQLARVERIEAHLDEHGLLDPDGEPRHVNKLWSACTNSAARLCDQLGLTPTSRARLGLDLSRTGAALAEHLDRNYGRDR